METKKWWQSKTNWLNIVAVVVAILLLVDKDLLSAFGVAHESQEKITKVLSIIIAAYNIYLRSGVQSPISTLPSGTEVAPNVKATIEAIKAKADIKENKAV